ncbi:MAG TPA: metal ABC transporter permease [bacterium]|nr:metal ABC transporter permease [bacterium]
MADFFAGFLQLFHSFPYAVGAGVILALACSFLGVLVVLNRLVFIGATLSEVAACGIAASLFYQIHPFWGALLLTLAAVSLLAFYSSEERLPHDSIMAAVFILTSSLAILFVSKSAFGLEEVRALLYGDLIITSAEDFKILSLAVIPPVLLTGLFLRPVVYTFLDRDAAKVLGIKTRLWELCFYYTLGIVVSAASKLGGMLLIFCYLVISPMIGLMLSKRLWKAMLIAAATALFSTFIGFHFSYVEDLPTNQAIIVTDGLMLVFAAVSAKVFAILRRSPKGL